MDDIPAITRDILCPQCQYNLRGLVGDVVNCPECGLQCDVARIIANRWEGPWHDAPGYSLVVVPSVIFLFGALPFSCWMVGNLLYRSPHGPDEWIMRVGLPLGIVAIWMMTLVPLFRYFGFKHGLRITALGHLLLLVYVVAMIGVPWFLIMASSERHPGYVIFAGLFAGLFYGCRVADRMIAESCIRLHLRFAARV